jgi:hypothetical protein
MGNNIKMDLQGIGCKNMDIVKCQDLLKMMNLSVSQKVEKILDS